MRSCCLSLLTFFLCLVAAAQKQAIEVFGTIKGTHHSKIYLFFEGNYRQKDSLSTQIMDGKFSFKTSVTLPILARLHLEGNSLIEDVYIDSKRTELTCSNYTNTWGSNNDTIVVFKINEVKGSKTEVLKKGIERSLTALNSSAKSDEEKKEEYFDLLYKFVAKHPGSKVSPYLLAQASTLRYSQVNSIYDLVSPSVHNTYEGKSVTRLLNRLDKSKNKAIGNAFLDVVLKDTSGRNISTKDLRGKYILVDFWASWCVPCRAMNPELKVLYSKIKDKEFEILGVSFDTDQGKWKGAIVKDDLPWLQLIDEKGFAGKLGEHYDIASIPQSILLGKDGKILAVGRISAKEIEDIIQKAP